MQNTIFHHAGPKRISRMGAVVRTMLLGALLGLAMLASPVNQASAAQIIKFGVVTTPGTAQFLCAEKFKEIFEARTGGDYEVRIFHSASLGSETDILQQIQMNAVQMAIITLGPFDAFVPEISVVGFPFLFSSFEQVDEILDGPLGDEVLGRLERAGFKGLAFSENGFRNLTNDRHPVHTVQDLDGLKIRVMESTLHKDLWRGLGSNPTPMAWPIYTELQQGTIDGQENPLSVIWLYKLYEVQRYLTLTGHVYSAHVDIANLSWFNGLPADIQAIMRESMREAARWERAWNRDNYQDFLGKLTAAGMKVVAHPDLDSFKQRAMQLKDTDLYARPETKELLERFLEATR